MYIVQNPVPQHFEEVLTRNTILAAKLGQIEEQLAEVGPAATGFWRVVTKVHDGGESIVDNLFLHGIE